ncbi:MAG: isochorismatase family cysteine hydrolase [Gemmatimonadota bacterium]
MNSLLFWDVDTQNDFIHPDGKLYVPGGEQIIPLLASLTEFAHRNHIRILASADDHQAGHRELSETPDFNETFPPHCMRGSRGQEKIPETALRNPLLIEPDHHLPGIGEKAVAHDGDILFQKHWFDVFTNPNVAPVVRALDPAAIVLYGVATDVCVRFAIEGLARIRPHTRLYFVTDSSRAIRPALAEHLLKEWAEEGIRLVRSEEILEGGVLETPTTSASLATS